MDAPSTTQTDLLLLGLLLDRPMHGYELYQQIQAEEIGAWFNVSPAGVYYSLHKLRDQGQVVESRQRRGESAHKSIYRLTEQGRSTFFATVEAELASEEMACLDYDLPVYLLNRLPRDRALSSLKQRQTFLSTQASALHTAAQVEGENGGLPLKLAIFDHKLRFLAMEQEWLAALVAMVQAGSKSSGMGEGQRRGLMILGGDLGDYHLPDLFHLIVSGGHSGTLRVTDGLAVRSLVFVEGKPVCASYLPDGEPAAATPSCDEVLCNLCEVFRWQEGQFTFDQEVEQGTWCVPLDCCAEELILRGCRTVDAWALIQRLVPSADLIFEWGPTARRLARLSLNPTEERAVAAVDGRKDVTALARELDLTLYETSQVLYCLTAIGVLQAADQDKILLRRVFREVAELMCKGTLAWRAAPDDRTCEEEVNRRVAHLPIRLNAGRIEDRTDPQLGADELRDMYRLFLAEQFKVVGRRFGRANAHHSFDQAWRHLAPELQETGRRYGLERVAMG